MHCLDRAGDGANRVQRGTNCTINDVDNVLNTTEQTELCVRRRWKDHANRERCDQYQSDDATPTARPAKGETDGDHNEEKSTHKAALLRSFHTDLTAPDASSTSSGRSAKPLGKSRASSRYDSNNGFSVSRLRK